MGTIDTSTTIKAATDSITNITATLANYMQEDLGRGSISWDYFCNNPDWTAYGVLAGFSILMGIIVVVLLVFIWGVAKHVSIRFRDISLKWCFCFVWLYGFVVYDVGMCTGQYISLLTNAPMAILYAFKIFLFDSDISEIQAVFHENWFYSMNFALVHFFAAVISTLFLIKYFGFNILARLRMCWTSYGFGRSVDDTFVFWGFDDHSMHLIESIKTQYAGSTNYRIVIVRTNKNEDEALEERTGIARIFDFLSMPTAELERLQKLGCLITGSYTRLSGVNVSGDGEDIIGSILRMKSLKKLLLEHTSRRIHMLFLSSDEKENLHDVSLLLNDSTVSHFVKQTQVDSGVRSDAGSCEDVPESLTASAGIKREVVFYCLARYNSIHRVIEDQNPSNQIRVKVIDSSHINVEMLKENPDLLPVKYVNVEADATVSSPFNALVVGFSEVGQDSVRFLYEFGAFVKSGSTDNIAARSDFHLDVVDKDMSDLAGVFVANAPAINPSMPFLKNGENSSALITLHQMDCRSVQFYQKLNEEWIGKLNYVVIATDDDELNISMGVRIFKAATRYRSNMENFGILVRAHNDDDGHISRIAEHYNRLWAAYISASEAGGNRIHQRSVKTGQSIVGPIHIFGLDCSTFTYGNIIADDLEKKARKYTQKYAETVCPARSFRVSAWDDNFNEIMQLEKEWEGNSPTYFGMMKLRRSQAQDIANSMHELTKKILADKALERCKQENFIFSRITRSPNTTRYIWPRDENMIDEINRIAIVIAQTEHLRWTASHEILGYVSSDVKDEVRFTHDCMKDWNLLTESVRSYDCNVADFILGIKISHE